MSPFAVPALIALPAVPAAVVRYVDITAAGRSARAQAATPTSISLPFRRSSDRVVTLG